MKKNTKEGSSLQKIKYVTPAEYVAVALYRIGGTFSSTLTGALSAAFLFEFYFKNVGSVGENEISVVSQRVVDIQMVIGILIGVLSGYLLQKWKTKIGRYRQWFFLNLIPTFACTALYFYVPNGWSEDKMIYFRYVIAVLQTTVNTFDTHTQKIVQVMSPDPNEKKALATCWQLFYYLGYGAAYVATFVYGKISDDQDSMYIRLAVVAAVVASIGNLMSGIFCKERIELPIKKKEKVSKDLLLLFKYRNYRAYQYYTWVNSFAMLGKMSTYLAAITVGSSKNLLLTLPTAVGTVVGNVLTIKLSKKHEPTKLLKFAGVYSLVSSIALFGICFIESKLGIYFFEGWNSIFFYVFYFLFGLGIGIQELSNSHFTVEFYDYLEWQTGKRMEAVQGIIPDWISKLLAFLRDRIIPVALVWVGYKKSDSNMVETMKAQPTYFKTCLWILAFLVFGYSIANFSKTIILKFLYDIEGEKKEKMYEELKEIRAKVHEGNTSTEPAAAE